MIYDGVLFAGEVDHLEMRFVELEPLAPIHVIAEGTTTLQGEPRSLVLPDLLASGRLDRWAERIRPVIVDDIPDPGGDPGGLGSPTFMHRERWIRDALMRGYPEATLDDLVLYSDADEIPTVEAVEAASRLILTGGTPYVVFWCHMYVWSRRWLWPGPSWNTCATRGRTFTPQQLRDLRGPMIDRGLIIPDAGWHLTWQGGVDACAAKLRSFSHREHLDKIPDLPRIIAEGVDINGVQLTPVDPERVPWPAWFADRPGHWL